MQPPPPSLDLDGAIAQAFTGCPKNYSDVGDLHKALMLMPSSSTGGVVGVTREHLSRAPDKTKEWIIELTGDILAGLPPSILKLGVVAPLPKDDTPHKIPARGSHKRISIKIKLKRQN